MANLLRLEELTKQLTEVENQFKNLFMFTTDLMCMASSDYRLIEINPAWERALGYSRDELLNKIYLDFVHPEDYAATKAVADGLMSKHATSFINRYRHKDGHYVTLEWNASPYSIDDRTYGVARVIKNVPE